MNREARLAIHVEKQLGWAHKLGGADSLRISKVSKTMLVRLMESQIQHQPPGSMALGGGGGAAGRRGTQKRTMSASCPVADTSASPRMPLVPFQLSPQHRNSE